MTTGAVMIVEVAPGGHRLVYVRLLADAALAAGKPVTLALSKSVIASEQFQTHLDDLAGQVRVESLSGDRLEKGEIRAMARSLGIEHIVIPHGDAFAVRELATGWTGPLVTVVIMRDPRGERFGVRRWLLNGAKSAAIAVAGGRRNVRVVWLGQYGDAEVRGRAVAYDPFIATAAKETLLAQGKLLRAQKLAPDVYWFASVGAISKRKNIELIARAVSRLSEDQVGPAGLYLCGSIDEDLGGTPELLRKQLPANMSVVIDAGVKTNDEINVAIAAADCVVTAYSIHYPNSTLIKALALGRVVVVAGSAFMQRRVKSLPGVLTCDVSEEELTRSLAQARLSTAPEPIDFGSEQFVNCILGVE